MGTMMWSVDQSFCYLFKHYYKHLLQYTLKSKGKYEGSYSCIIEKMMKDLKRRPCRTNCHVFILSVKLLKHRMWFLTIKLDKIVLTRAAGD